MDRVRAEYLEMPGLGLTESEARGFFGLDAIECREVLLVLLETGFLQQSLPGGLYIRASA